MKTCFIYALTDPRTNRVRYVGKTTNIIKRLNFHCHDSSQTHKANWIRSLQVCGLKPAIEILAEVSREQWQEAERIWIKFFRDIGAELTNATDGGEGLINYTPEMRVKMGYWKGKKQSAETCRKRNEANKGRRCSEATRQKIRDGRVGAKNPMYGKSCSEAAKSLISLRLTGIHRSPETRAKMSAAAQKRSPEHYEKAWNTRRKNSE